VIIQSVRHKGLRRFLERGDRSGLPQAFVEKINRLLTALEVAGQLEQLETMPGWRLHALAGSEVGRWSLVVSRNWRLTFRVDAGGQDIFDLDLEDYH
jgi:proteic killer suppression protein